MDVDGDLIDDAEKLAGQHGMQFFLASARSNINIHAIYYHVINELVAKAKENTKKVQDDAKTKSSVVFDNGSSPKKSSCC